MEEGGAFLPDAIAQVNTDVEVKTSAGGGSNAGSFFGHGILRVSITDKSADSSEGEEINVRIDADGLASESMVIEVPDTSEGSGRFDFFITHVDSIFDLDELNPSNSDLAEGMTGAGPRAAPIVTFGAGGDLETGEALFNEVNFEVEYDDNTISFNYEEAAGEISLDREAYGSDSIVYVHLEDQDANLNPTKPDAITVSNPNMGILFELDGGTFQDDVLFEETGTNTAIFEAALTLTNDISSESPSDVADADIDFLEWDSESANISLNDMANYDEDIDDDGTIDIELDDPDVNDSTDTSEVSFTISDKNGAISLEPATLTFGSEMQLILKDNDQNRDSNVEDELTDVITVSIDNAGGDEVVFGMKETNDNSGVFEIDLSNNELEITFCADGDISCPDESNSILEFREGDIAEKITLFYTDSLDEDSTSKIFRSGTFELSTTLGIPSIRPIAGKINEVLVAIYDPDLDNNAKTKESYSFTLIGTDPVPLKKSGGSEIGELGELEVKLEGEIPNYDGSRTFTLIETGEHTGNFTTEISSKEYQDVANLLDPLGDQEIVELTYHDNMEDPDREVSFIYQLAKRITPLIFSRSVIPTPGTDIDNDGDVDPVSVTWKVVDPAFNDKPGSEESIPFRSILFEIVMTKADGEEIVILDRVTNHLSDILEDVPTSLTETGPNTSIFSTDFKFKMGGEFVENEDWQDAKFTVTYIEDSVFLDDDRNSSSGISFTGHAAQLSTNATSARSGQLLYFTVEDDDLNLDDSNVDIFESSLIANSEAILTVETEHDDVGESSTETFRETGPNTGIFQAVFEVGKDIPITTFASGEDKVDQASNILVTYNDKIDATGHNGDELKIDIPIVSSTGTIQVFPELVGPGTRIIAMISDSDLDQKSGRIDDYDPQDANTGSFFVSFRTDRNEVNSASPHLVETAPDTGIFEFTIGLVTDEQACQDDDLGDDKFDATGGNDPSIGTCPGDFLLIKYEDEQDSNGQSRVVSEMIEIKSFDPTFATDKQNYGVGDKVIVSIADPDANRNPDIADSLTDLTIFSEGNRVDNAMSALETGRNTGVFKLSILTTLGGSLMVELGENVTVVYKDEFPGDFEEYENEKEFEFTIPISGILDETTTASSPFLKDVSGGELEKVETGQQVVLSSQLQNNNFASLPFVSIIEVRDDSGVTVFLAWQTGTVAGSGQTEVGVSWTPEMQGHFSLRTFVMSDLSNSQVLSEVSTSNVVVIGGDEEVWGKK